VRLRDLGRDPLLKVGAWAMVVALGFAIVVAVGAYLDRPMEVAAASAATPEPKPATESLARTDPGINPWVERDIPPPKPKVTVLPQPEAASGATSRPEPIVGKRPVSVPEPSGTATTSAGNYPPQTREQTREQPRPAGRASHYHLPPGAIMTLTIPELGLRNAPVLNSDATSALDRGVVHLPDTSLPWSDTPERNVYLAGHRLGWPGTGSHLVFYRLDKLTGGEKVTLRGPNGKRYDYRVLESFIIEPHETWVTGRVEGRDLLTLQTCTPIPTFQYRLIVRAERI
jgi:sortase A